VIVCSLRLVFWLYKAISTLGYYIFGCFVCAVLDDNVGYATGHCLGQKLFQRKDSWLFHNVGGAIWTIGITLLGFFLGQVIPAEQIDKYLLPIIAAIIFFSVLPSLLHLYKEYRTNKQ
jgi:membrane-associated protein